MWTFLMCLEKLLMPCALCLICQDTLTSFRAHLHTHLCESRKKGVKKKRELGGELRLCSGPSSHGGIFIFLKLIFFLKLLFCTLICSFCPCSAPHAPDLVINFLSRVQQFIGLSLQSRNWSHTYPDKTVLMSLKPGAEGLDELILQP